MLYNKPLRVLCVLLLLLFLFPAIAVAVSCSGHIGKASINEVYELGNSFWIEIKMIDPAVSYDGWQLKLCSKQGNNDNCETYGIGSLILQNSYYLVVSNIDKKYIDIQQNGESDILLVDSSGAAVDYLSINGYTHQKPPSCTFSYPTTITTSSNKKGIYRSPDGTGSWKELEGSGATGETTRGGSNDGDDGDDDAPTCDDVMLSPIGPQISGVKSEEYSICINDIEDNPVFNLDYECVNPLVCAGALNVSVERVQGSCLYFNLNFHDVGKIKLDASITVNDGQLSCSSNEFVVKPHHFEISDIVCNDGNENPDPSAVDHNGEVFCKAGHEFTITVTAKNALGDTTQNFGEEDAPQLVTLEHNLIGPAGGSLGELAGNLSLGNFSQGVAQGVTLIWSEVGIITITPKMSNYLGAGDVVGNVSANIGRFRPDRFTTSIIDNGDFEDACSGFTYSGQPFTYNDPDFPKLLITAVNSDGNTTTNYRGDFAKLTDPATQINMPTVTSDASNLGADGTTLLNLAWSPRVFLLVANNDGTLNFTLKEDQFIYTREANALVAPINSDIQLPIKSIIDSDSVTASDLPRSFIPSATEIRYGRLLLDNAYGSETLPLTIPVRTEYYAGSAFILNESDNCTDYAFDSLALIMNLANSGTTTASGNGTLVSGLGYNLILSAPGVGHEGSVDLTLDLSLATGLNLEWLRPEGVDPTAKATFGIFKGNPRLIYTRESVW